MGEGYSRIRVETTPPALARPLPIAVTDTRDAEYWKREAHKAIREREEIKKALEATDGPAAYFRRLAKDATKKLTDALKRADGARSREQKAQAELLECSEQLDAAKGTVAGVKRQLWDVWSGLDDENPAKRQLWEIWAAL